MNYTEWKAIPNKEWLTQPISCTCEVALCCNPIMLCDKPTVKAYPTMFSGWMGLCARHALKHKEAFPVEELIRDGETWR